MQKVIKEMIGENREVRLYKDDYNFYMVELIELSDGVCIHTDNFMAGREEKKAIKKYNSVCMSK